LILHLSKLDVGFQDLGIRIRKTNPLKKMNRENKKILLSNKGRIFFVINESIYDVEKKYETAFQYLNRNGLTGRSYGASYILIFRFLQTGNSYGVLTYFIEHFFAEYNSSR